MGFLDDAVPSVSKPLMIALGALLASGALFQKRKQRRAAIKPNNQ
jgi:hypothetical protein